MDSTNRQRDSALQQAMLADDSDEANLCSTCAFSGACVAAGYTRPDLARLHCLIEHTDSYQPGEYVFRTLDPFRAIYAVRAGSVKTVVVDLEGREQVLGFYLPGEVIGLNAIYPEHYPCDAISLETTLLCRFSFPAMSALAAQVPNIQKHLFQLLSKELGMASTLASAHSADERMAAFMINLGSRYAAAGLPASRLHLSMSRGDIANYLGVAAETVSRVLARFREQGLIHVDGRYVEIRDNRGLHELARCVLGT